MKEIVEGKIECPVPGCDKSCESGNGLTSHLRMAHKINTDEKKFSLLKNHPNCSAFPWHREQLRRKELIKQYGEGKGPAPVRCRECKALVYVIGHHLKGCHGECRTVDEYKLKYLGAPTISEDSHKLRLECSQKRINPSDKRSFQEIIDEVKDREKQKTYKEEIDSIRKQAQIKIEEEREKYNNLLEIFMSGKTGILCPRSGKQIDSSHHIIPRKYETDYGKKKVYEFPNEVLMESHAHDQVEELTEKLIESNGHLPTRNDLKYFIYNGFPGEGKVKIHSMRLRNIQDSLLKQGFLLVDSSSLAPVINRKIWKNLVRD